MSDERKLDEAPAPGCPVSAQELLQAATIADWGQVVANGGPPCFHIEDGRFCLRAERWDGHRAIGFHSFVSLRQLLEQRTTALQSELRVTRKAIVIAIRKSGAKVDNEWAVADEIIRLLEGKCTP